MTSEYSSSDPEFEAKTKTRCEWEEELLRTSFPPMRRWDGEEEVEEAAKRIVPLCLFADPNEETALLGSIELFSRREVMALNPLPFGAVVPLSVLPGSDDGGKEGVLTRWKEEANYGQMESLEHLAVSYLGQVKHKQAIRIWATQFSSPGQMVHGYSHKKRVDAAVLLKPGHLAIYQVHENSHVQGGGHLKNCPLFDGRELQFNPETRRSDEFNKMLADRLTATGLWNVSYSTVSECQLIHGMNLQHEENGNVFDHAAAPVGKEALITALEGLIGEENFLSVAKPIRELHDHGVLTASQVEKFIMDNKREACGFVVIENGKENEDDVASWITGFSLQKSRTDHSELGEGNLELSKQRMRIKYKKKEGEDEQVYEDFIESWAKYELDQQGANGYTMLRSHFSGVICLHVSQFRFLKEHRKLDGYKIKHYYHYKGMKFLRPRLHDLLRRRFELKRKEKTVENEIGSQSIKLQLNGFYGYSLLSKNTEPPRICTEGTLYKKGFPEYFVNMTTLGLIPQRKVRKRTKDGWTEIEKEAEFLFLLNSPEENNRSENLCQIGSAILAYSKVLFLGHLEFLLDSVSPYLAELLYVDTDSMMWWIAEDDLPSCVPPDKRAMFDKVAAKMFQDGKGFADDAIPCTAVPHSRLKYEGTFSAALIRSIKCYYLHPFEEEEKPWIKCKGVKGVVRKNLKPENFKVGEENPFYYKAFGMKATAAKEMTIELTSRKQMSCINYKRNFHKNLVTTSKIE